MKTLLLMVLLAASGTPEAPAPASKAPARAPKAAKAPAKKAGAAKQAAPEPEPEPPSRLPQVYRWRVPGMVAWVDSAGVQVTNGVPMVLQMARSTWTVDALAQHFADEFEAANLYIPTDVVQFSPLQEPFLTAFDPERSISYTVVFQENPDRTTTVVLGTADMAQYDPLGQSKLDWAPVMPGAEDLMRTDMEGAQAAVYSVQATEAAVRDFYRKELRAAGWREEEAEPGLFRRPGEALRVYSQQEPGEPRRVNLTRRSVAVEQAEEAPARKP